MIGPGVQLLIARFLRLGPPAGGREDATLARVRDQSAFGGAILDKQPQIARVMYIAQLIDEGTLRARIVSMGRRTSKERIAHLICELYLRARNVSLEEGESMTLSLSQVALFDAVGLTPLPVNRVLRALRVEGAMTLQRGSLNIADPYRLARIAGFDENYLHRRMSVAA